MRKTNKVAMYSVFNEISTTFQDLDDAVFIVDGGFLLHHVVWPSHIQGMTYDEVYDTSLTSNSITTQMQSLCLMDTVTQNLVQNMQRQ